MYTTLVQRGRAQQGNIWKLKCVGVLCVAALQVEYQSVRKNDCKGGERKWDLLDCKFFAHIDQEDSGKMHIHTHVWSLLKERGCSVFCLEVKGQMLRRKKGGGESRQGKIWVRGLARRWHLARNHHRQPFVKRGGIIVRFVDLSIQKRQNVCALCTVMPV